LSNYSEMYDHYFQSKKEPKPMDQTIFEVTFREQLAADIFTEAAAEIVSGFGNRDFEDLAVQAVRAADSLISELRKSGGLA